jgi:acyl dehydratase
VHTDAEFAVYSRLGKPIAHGLLGISVAMGLVSRFGIFKGSSIAMLGVDDWQFRAPTVAGDTDRCEVRILAVRPTSNGEASILDRQFNLLNQRDEPVQQGRIGLMVARRPTN